MSDFSKEKPSLQLHFIVDVKITKHAVGNKKLSETDTTKTKKKKTN